MWSALKRLCRERVGIDWKREIIHAWWKGVPTYTTMRLNAMVFRIPLQRNFDYRILRRNKSTWMDEIIQCCGNISSGVFVDVGANVGQTLLKVKSLLPEVRYVGFEPNIHCAGYISELIHINHLKHCDIFPIGLGCADTTTTLFYQKPSDPNATVIANFRGNEHTMQRQTVIIRDAGIFLSNLALHDIAVIKIDVEGYEAAVLSGLRDLLQCHRPFVICEVLRAHRAEHPSHAFRVQSRSVCDTLLRQLDYVMWGVNGTQKVEACDGISDTYTNYVFIPQEKVAAFTAAYHPGRVCRAHPE